MGRNVRKFEAVVDKSNNNTFKMAFYGAYFSLFTEDLKTNALKNMANPSSELIKGAWNYPDVFSAQAGKSSGQKLYGAPGPFC